MQSFDIVINGGGIVGLSLACGLHGSGLRVAVIEHQTLKVIPFTKEPSLRVSAINVASRCLLQHIKVWDAIVAERANPYRTIEVWERDSFGHIVFNGAELGYPALGYIIENSVIYQALLCRAMELSEVTILTSTSFRQVVWGKDEVFITLDNDRILTTKLMVAADGAHSLLRTYSDIPMVFWNYQHHALVANVRTEQPHRNIARQTFYGDGILAFLPLSDPNLSSIVWSMKPEVACENLKASKEKFNMTLATTFSLTLGLCELQSERQTFPIIGRYARNFAAHRLVLIGDAAHTIHPLAGQGMNLGFMDVSLLLEEVLCLRRADKDIGYYPYLRRYERRRKQSVTLMLTSIHGLYELFSSQNPLKKWIRNIGFRIIDIIPGTKLCLVQRAIGLYDLPSSFLNKYLVK